MEKHHRGQCRLAGRGEASEPRPRMDCTTDPQRRRSLEGMGQTGARVVSAPTSYPGLCGQTEASLDGGWNGQRLRVIRGARVEPGSLVVCECPLVAST